MPLLAVAVAFVAVAILFFALLPLMLIQRYRVGTRRQPVRGWFVALNIIGLVLSSVLFLAGAAFTTFWIPHAFVYAVAGLLTGVLLGGLGLVLTRWEATRGAVYFTPNRWLVLIIMLAVSGRLLYGLWRAWEASRSIYSDTHWAAAAGVPQSLAAGGLAIGYYLGYWFGVRRRFRRHMRA